MEALATAIISSLISGSADVSKQAVKDAYTSAKALLKEYVPRFDSDLVRTDVEDEKISELAKRLQGLTINEQKDLVEKMMPLAEAMGATQQSEKFKYFIKNVQVGKDAEFDLAGQGDHHIEGLTVIEKLRIKTGK